MSDWHPKPEDRDKAILLARQLLQRSFVIVDTETTGLLRDKVTKSVTPAEVCQIGALTSDGETIFDTLIKPKYPIPPEATAIHGITNEMVDSAPSFAAIWGGLQCSLQGRNVVIYNVDFDRGLLGRHVSDLLGDPADAVNWACRCRWYCAMKIYAAFVGEIGRYGDYKWQKLPNSEEDAHSALSDCRATLRIIREMAESPLFANVEE